MMTYYTYYTPQHQAQEEGTERQEGCIFQEHLLFKNYRATLVQRTGIGHYGSWLSIRPLSTLEDSIVVGVGWLKIDNAFKFVFTPDYPKTVISYALPNILRAIHDFKYVII